MKTIHLISLSQIILIIIGSVSVKQVHTNVVNVTSSHELPVRFNDTVVITCQLQRLDNDTHIPVLFLHENDIVSENCYAFSQELYAIDCSSKTEIKLEIKRMSWRHRGTWKCMYNLVTKSVHVDIYLPSNVSISINKIPQPIKSPNLGPASIPMRHEISTRLRGGGIPEYPFDLRHGINVNLVCKSDCGYPEVYHVYNFKNSSNYSLQLTKTSFNFKSTICENERKTSSAISTLILNCKKLKLYGLFNLSCATYHSFKQKTQMKISEEKISILCTTDPINWWAITDVEMVHIGVGCVIALIYLMYLCWALCRWKSNNRKKYECCQHNNGNTNTRRRYRVKRV